MMKRIFTIVLFCLVNTMVYSQIEMDAQLQERQLIESSITLLENKEDIVPLLKLDTLVIASLSIGETMITPYQSMLGNYVPIDHFNISWDYPEDDWLSLKNNLVKFNLVIVGMHPLSKSEVNPIMCHPNIQDSISKNILDNWVYFLNSVLNPEKTVMTLFSSEVESLFKLWKPASLIMAYQNDTLSQELAAQLIFGGIGAFGKLTHPFMDYKVGEGISIEKPIRLKYTIPEEVGMSSFRLNHRIDSIIHKAIGLNAFPGCNLLVAKDGKIIFHKAYGYHTYDKIQSAKKSDIYDLASVTKVSGALPALMKLNDDGLILLDEKFSNHWSDWKKRWFHRSNKADLTLRELLAHQAGLIPYIPFWKRSVKNEGLSHRHYAVDRDKKYSLAVAPGLYLDGKFKKHVYKTIRLSDLSTRGKYVYSDLPFVIFPEVVAKVSGMGYQEFLETNFYRSLGASTLTYNPLEKFPVGCIVPTELDQYYRKRLVHGSVHDEAAAVLGGVSGNAGLFSTANDLAKLVQMYVQMGNYGGKEYITKATMREFIKIQYPENNNRRALGFDKPLFNNFALNIEDAYPAPGVSSESFGHSGFTGTFIWADPVYNMVYIFLSNRVNPTRYNSNLSKLNVRVSIQQIFYDEIFNCGDQSGVH